MEEKDHEKNCSAVQQRDVHQYDGGQDEGRAAAKSGYDCSIAAYALSDAKQVATDADCILVGPQVKHKLAQVQADCPGVPAAAIEMKDYGMMNSRPPVR